METLRPQARETLLPASTANPSQPQAALRKPVHEDIKSPRPSASSPPVGPSKPRLPPTIDSSLAPYCGSARDAFFRALVADQQATLQPDYRTPFQDAEDVVKRLLPYHVWQINEDDLYHVLESGLEAEDKAMWEDKVRGEDKAMREETGKGGSRRKGIKRQREQLLESVASAFPTNEQTMSLFERYGKLSKRVKQLQIKLTGENGSGCAPYAAESTNLLDRLAMESEREALVLYQETFRREKEKAAAMGVGWEQLMRITSGVHMYPSAAHGAAVADSEGSEAAAEAAEASPSPAPATPPLPFSIPLHSSSSNLSPTGSFQPSISTGATVQTHMYSPTSPFGMRSSRPRGRPRKQRDEHGRIIHSPGGSQPPSRGSSMPGSPQNVVKPPVPPSSSNHPTVRPPAVASAARPPNSAIPSHPIPLLLPLSTLPRLSALGITPIPAPHLVPAIQARQAAQANASTPLATLPWSQFNTAPRPAQPNQQEAALLTGITTSRPSADGPAQEMLHISVVLSKFGPSQLSGLAALMQNVQAGSTPTSGGLASGSSNGNATTTGVRPFAAGPASSPAGVPPPRPPPSNHSIGRPTQRPPPS